MTIERVEILLLIAAVVAMVARRLRVPYSIGLVAAGVALAILPFSSGIELTKQLIFTTLLPPLIFEAAFQLRWPKLRSDLPIIVTLATVGVAIRRWQRRLECTTWRSGPGQLPRFLACSLPRQIRSLSSPHLRMPKFTDAFACW